LLILAAVAVFFASASHAGIVVIPLLISGLVLAWVES
jgi:hypothetical protein